jgi:hypothetical protein
MSGSENRRNYILKVCQFSSTQIFVPLRCTKTSDDADTLCRKGASDFGLTASEIIFYQLAQHYE